MLLAVLHHIDVLRLGAQLAVSPLQSTEEVLKQPLAILYRFRERVIVEGQGGKQVRWGEVGVQQPAKPSFCVPSVQFLLDLCGWFAPFPSSLWLVVYWEYLHFQILPAIMFPFSIFPLHISSLSLMVVVLIPYTSSAYGKKSLPSATVSHLK